ncbi:hypothetical protein [Amedibacillus dolichus]|uniref:hypothetical protein n=1 Tax=Amedibacillus dolichus TaxID=31971 RepID=UPI00241E75C2|nr:hypothetical protein [Amedibacillus dolichus]
MIDTMMFKKWLTDNTTYSSAVITDIVSRMKRADSMMTWEPTTIYLFKLEQSVAFKRLSVSVKSQIRKSVKFYTQFIKDTNGKIGVNQ